MSTISAGTRQELVTAVADRYQQSTSAEKRLILDEFVALTGYHRKHAVRVLNGSATTPRARRGRRCVYDAAVTEGLIVLWEASDRMCGKRLKALLPTLVPALEHHGHLCLDPAVREGLLAVIAAAIDRRLASARAVTAGQRRRRHSGLNGLQGSVPVRTFGDWRDPAPGFVEADLVAHCGGTLSLPRRWRSRSLLQPADPLFGAQRPVAVRVRHPQQAADLDGHLLHLLGGEAHRLPCIRRRMQPAADAIARLVSLAGHRLCSYLANSPHHADDETFGHAVLVTSPTQRSVYMATLGGWQRHCPDLGFLVDRTKNRQWTQSGIWHLRRKGLVAKVAMSPISRSPLSAPEIGDRAAVIHASPL